MAGGPAKALDAMSLASNLRKLLDSNSTVHPTPNASVPEDLPKLESIASRLKTLCCERYQFGGRNVFGEKEQEDGEKLVSGNKFYTWPKNYKHEKARDSHPDLQERFPVSDDHVIWESELKYNPKYASDDDSVEPQVQLPRNPCGRYFRFSNP
jgi:hypothetical protein